MSIFQIYALFNSLSTSVRTLTLVSGWQIHQVLSAGLSVIGQASLEHKKTHLLVSGFLSLDVGGVVVEV